MKIKCALEEAMRILYHAPSLGIDHEEGMIFKFESEGVHSLWMLNMQFPLDMIWFDSDGRVVHIEENVQSMQDGT